MKLEIDGDDSRDNLESGASSYRAISWQWYLPGSERLQ